MKADVQVVIHDPPSGRFFTGEDAVRGEVKLSIASSLSLACIQVKLEGISSTQMMVPDSWSKKPKERVLHDSHKFLYETIVVFPPQNVRQVSSNTDFTLGPGTYTYPFELHFPKSTHCSQISGLTNVATINKKTRTVVLNNGNFGVDKLQVLANSYVQSISSPSLQQQQRQDRDEELRQISYHGQTPLPPSFSYDGGSSEIHYFVKATCKRSSLFKQNFRKTSPFRFLPLDPRLNRSDENLNSERFFRKEVLFANRRYSLDTDSVKSLPDVPNRQGFLQSFFRRKMLKKPPGASPRQNSKKQIPYGVEVRLEAGARLVPGHHPPFKIFLTSEFDPSSFSLSQYGKASESNGLGIVYIQSMSIELESLTVSSVLETSANGNEIHEQESKQRIPLCKNVYNNLKFDLIDAASLLSISTSTSDYVSPNFFQLEIPRRFYENCRVPNNIVPNFQTCNISRSYNLVVLLGLSSEPVTSGSQNHANQAMVDIVCSNVIVLSGLHSCSNPAPLLHKRSAPPFPERPSPALPSRSKNTEKGDQLFHYENKDSQNNVAIEASSGRTEEANSHLRNDLDGNNKEAPPSYTDALKDT